MKPGTAFGSTCLAAFTLLLAQTSPPPRGPGAPNAEERERMEKIIPARAPAKPAKARRMLVLDINIGHGQHPSIPFAKLALELMASHTKAFEPVFDDNPEMLKAANLKNAGAGHQHWARAASFDPVRQAGLGIDGESHQGQLGERD